MHIYKGRRRAVLLQETRGSNCKLHSRDILALFKQLMLLGPMGHSQGTFQKL